MSWDVPWFSVSVFVLVQPQMSLLFLGWIAIREDQLKSGKFNPYETCASTGLKKNTSRLPGSCGSSESFASSGSWQTGQ